MDMAKHRVSYHVHAHRDREDPSVVICSLHKHWWAPLLEARTRIVAEVAMATIPGESEAVVLADVLVELARSLRGELYQL